MTNEATKHPFKSSPTRGERVITVRLCYDCDHWHAEDDSLLYNESDKRDWETVNAALEAQLKASNEKVVRLREALEWILAEVEVIEQNIEEHKLLKPTLKAWLDKGTAALNPEASAEPGQET